MATKPSLDVDSVMQTSCDKFKDLFGTIQNALLSQRVLLAVPLFDLPYSYRQENQKQLFVLILLGQQPMVRVYAFSAR